MGKKRKPDLSGKTSMEEGTSDTFPSSILDVLMQFKEMIQVKVNTDECHQKLEETTKKLVDKVKRLEEKMKKNKIKEVEKKEQMKEDLKRELILFFQQQMQKLEEKVENKSKEHFSMFMEDFKKQPEEVKEEPYLEMRKEGSAKANRCGESSPLRSQLHQSQTTSFHLKFACEMDPIAYKGKPMLTIEVVLYDGENPIAADHHLASEAAELVVVDGEFGGQIQGWSEDEFDLSTVKTRQWNNSQGKPPRVKVKNGRFKLVGGRYRLEGVAIMENSNRKDVKLGVMIVGKTKERVLEGVSNSFRVQEAKTAEKRGKRTTDETPEDIPRSMEQNNSHVRTKKGNGSVGPLPSEPSQYPTQEDTNQPESYEARGPQYSVLTGWPINFENISDPSGVTYPYAAGQVQQHLFTPTQQNIAFMPNQLQRTHARAVGNGPDSQPLIGTLHQRNTTQQENHGKGQQYNVPKTGPINFPNMPDPSDITYPYTTESCFIGPLLLEPSKYPSQHDTTQLQSYGQSSQQKQQQRNSTQQSATQLEDHGTSSQMRTSSPCADDPLGEVVRLSSGLPDDLSDEFGYTEPVQHAVAAGTGRHSAGTRHWSIDQLPRSSHPQTEDEYQDGGAVLFAAVPAPESTQMDFTQATTTGSQATRHEAHLLELQRHLPWQ
uniref:Uncharacterized protein n=1 Tax=Avena sativa TaxID=4498 RepID=A0ACD5UJ78_AVESA